MLVSACAFVPNRIDIVVTDELRYRVSVQLTAVDDVSLL
jgi:hypothetical protein